MSTQDARNFLESIGTYLNNNNGGTGGASGSTFKLGTVGSTTQNGMPTIIFDGETKASAKGYAWVSGYHPVAGDRVYLIPINGSYLIGGKVQAGGTGIGTTDQVVGPLLTGTEKPAGVPYKRFSGYLSTSTGAGGENRTANLATDSVGVGGWWFGYQGLPTFKGIYSVQLTGYHVQNEFRYYASVATVSTTRIMWQGTRLAGGGYTNGYGGINMFVEVLGW